MQLSYDGFHFNLNQAYAKSTLFMSVSGSHAYGWDTATSDLDVRMTWLPSIRQALNIFHRKHPIEQRFTEDKKLIDLTIYPIQNFLGLLEKGNGNCLENLFQHKIIERKRLTQSLQKLMLKNLHVGFLKHYLGYSQSLMKDLSIPSRLQAYGEQKLLLQAYRVLLTGWLLGNYKEVVFDLPSLMMYEAHSEYTTYTCSNILDDYLNNKTTPQSLLEKARRDIQKLQLDLDYLIFYEYQPTSDQLGLKEQLNNWLYNYYKI